MSNILLHMKTRRDSQRKQNFKLIACFQREQKLTFLLKQEERLCSQTGNLKKGAHVLQIFNIVRKPCSSVIWLRDHGDGNQITIYLHLQSEDRGHCFDTTLPRIFEAVWSCAISKRKKSVSRYVKIWNVFEDRKGLW